MVVFFDNKPPIRLHPLATHVVSVVEEESSKKKKNPICVGTRIWGGNPSCKGFFKRECRFSESGFDSLVLSAGSVRRISNAMGAQTKYQRCWLSAVVLGHPYGSLTLFLVRPVRILCVGL